MIASAGNGTALQIGYEHDRVEDQQRPSAADDYRLGDAEHAAVEPVLGLVEGQQEFARGTAPTGTRIRVEGMSLDQFREGAVVAGCDR